MSETTINHEENRERLKRQIALNKQKLEQSARLVFDIVELVSIEEHTYITFDDLRQFPLDELVKVGKIEFEKIKETDRELVFMCYSKLGFSNNLHSHDCTEILTILEGDLHEPEYGYKMFSKGDVVMYPPKFKHRPYCHANTKWKVRFVKDIV